MPLWVAAPEPSTAGAALLDFRTGGDWSSAGVPAILGMYGTMQTMLDSDCAVRAGRIVFVELFPSWLNLGFVFPLFLLPLVTSVVFALPPPSQTSNS